jgi:hypothetical protein
MGNAGISKTIFFFLVCAVFLLTYVTAQIYSGVLSERISGLSKDQLVKREEANKLTSKYISLASRERIAGYCSKNLGMVEADNGDLKRVTVDFEFEKHIKHGEFARKRRLIPEVLSLPLHGSGKRE